MRTILTCTMLLFCGLLSAQSPKSNLDFQVKTNTSEEKLEVEWNACLENSQLFVLDAEGNELSVQPICKNNPIIDFSAFEAGVYTIRIEHYTGLGERRVVKHRDAALSLELEKPNLEFNLFPNPSSNHFMIETSACLENSVLTINDLQGRCIRTIALCKNGSIVDVSDLPKGMYFVKIEHYTGVGVQRLVKQ